MAGEGCGKQTPKTTAVNSGHVRNVAAPPAKICTHLGKGCGGGASRFR